MKRKNLIFVAILIIVLATIIERTLETIFGADNVFYGCLLSLPFLLVWCLATDTKKPHRYKGKILLPKENNHYNS
jgi:hypothetical protein|tara:strand:- start:1316 stop:1540 length:225 start_codon:yes stop_codon:yes gene_type:complete